MLCDELKTYDEADDLLMNKMSFGPSFFSESIGILAERDTKRALATPLYSISAC